MIMKPTHLPDLQCHFFSFIQDKLPIMIDAFNCNRSCAPSGPEDQSDLNVKINCVTLILKMLWTLHSNIKDSYTSRYFILCAPWNRPTLVTDNKWPVYCGGNLLKCTGKIYLNNAWISGQKCEFINSLHYTKCSWNVEY